MRALIFMMLLGLATTGLGQDQLTTQAVKRLDKVEAKLKDGATAQDANRLIQDLNWVVKRLNAVYKKDEPHWKAAVARHKKLVEQVQGLSNQGGTGAGDDTSGIDLQALQGVEKEISNAHHNLNILNKTFIGSRGKLIATEIDRLHSRLEPFPKDHPRVKTAALKLKAYEDQFKKWTAEYEADMANSGDANKRLAIINERYRGSNLPEMPTAPFQTDALKAWAQALKKLHSQDLPADEKYLVTQVGNAGVDKQLVSSLLHAVRIYVPGKLKEAVLSIRDTLNGQIHGAKQFANFIASTDTSDYGHVANRLLGEGALARGVQNLKRGLLAVEQAHVVDTELGIKDPPDRKAQAQELKNALKALREMVKSAQGQVRMPKGVKQDAELLNTAKSILKGGEAKDQSIKRMVMTTKKTRREEKSGTLSGRSPNTIDVELFHYIWDEFTVATAEKNGDGWWIYYSTFKNYTSGGRRTPLNKWILSGRTKTIPILKENIDKSQ